MAASDRFFLVCGSLHWVESSWSPLIAYDPGCVKRQQRLEWLKNNQENALLHEFWVGFVADHFHILRRSAFFTNCHQGSRPAWTESGNVNSPFGMIR